jgi:transcription-repair coupling factor (superfamily II helicase)
MQVGSMLEALDGPVRTMLDRAGPVALPPLPAGAAAAIAHAVRRMLRLPLIWVGHGRTAADSAMRDLATLSPENPPALLHFPAHDIADASGSSPRVSRDPEIEGRRLRALRVLAAAAARKEPPVVVTEIQALLQRTPTPAAVKDAILRISEGDTADPHELARRLAEMGYEQVPLVTAPAQAALRGGLLDLWPPGDRWPSRMEWFGQNVESLRIFDPEDQVSISRTAEVLVLPAGEPGGCSGFFGDFLSRGAILWWSDPDSLREHSETLLSALNDAGLTPAMPDYDSLRAALSAGADVVSIDANAIDARLPPGLPAFHPFPSPSTTPGDPLAPDMADSRRRELIRDLTDRVAEGWRIIALLDTDGALHHFRGSLPEDSGVTAETGSLSEGFLCPELKLAVVSESDIYGRKKLQPGSFSRAAKAASLAANRGRRIDDLSAIQPGELVVHADHGIGRYLGLFEIRVHGQVQEVVSIEYDQGAKLHVPVSQAHLLSRYTGVSSHRVALHRIGGRRWIREKREAGKAIEDLAAALLETQARRKLLPGHAFTSDAPWQTELENAFPYRETRDQALAVTEVKRDMESSRPMDRLVCGDAGYGKTEVAVRAAFKAVMDGKQVAVLVPTTVLASQHLVTFTDRMLAFPVRIMMLSRFCSQVERRKAVEACRNGTADIVIGTHALLQPGVRFKDLGLVIVDEEQRFGVRHKEWLKHMREIVDVLTMTATPIPRTLYYSLTGARDMSLIQTAPRERIAVETIVTRNDDRTVRSAIMRELNRGGQVFYLHNRVMTIGRVARRLAELVPEARVAVAHGRMPASELSGIVGSFIGGNYDLLLCTTIIESGVDIPRANTILIDRADRFGLADLYQLRGRVGRSNLKGYAYMLLPPHGAVESEARRRLEALLRHSELGAGFQLALRDLEIRGAGNLLGDQQSGHINAVGFGLYCQLLKRSIAVLKGEKPAQIVETEVRLDFLSLTAERTDSGNSASIPSSYVEDEPIRIGIYRRMAEASETEEINAIRSELADRFGPVPAPLDRLLKVCALRAICARASVRRLEVRDGKAVFSRETGGPLMKGARLPRLRSANADEQLQELTRLAETIPDWSR